MSQRELSQPASPAPHQASRNAQNRTGTVQSQLYHYTSEVGFRGIIESNSLWATHFEDLNDSNEIIELRPPLIGELTTAFIPLIKDFRKGGHRQDQLVSKQGGNVVAANKIAQDWVNALYSTTFGAYGERLSLCCVTSFCTHSDDQEYERENGLLSQWRGYGGSGGFCLVFDTEKLIEMLERERKTFLYVHLDLQPAHYFTGGTSLMRLFPELMEHSKAIVQSAISGDKSFSADQMFVPFVRSTTTTKHRGFFEEREVRIISMPATPYAEEQIKGMDGYIPMPLKNVFTTERDGRERRHVSIFGKSAGPLPIKRIIVGPSRNQAQNREVAQTVAGKDVSVVCSATPFLG